MNSEDKNYIQMVVKETPSKLKIILDVLKYKLKTTFCIHEWKYSYSKFWNDNIRECNKCGKMELQTQTQKKWN